MAKLTLADAQKLVPTYIQPSDCFVVHLGNKLGYAVLEGTPCAHYVSHVLGIKGNQAFGGYGCYKGFELRVAPLLKNLKEVPLSDVMVNDVWARLKGNQSAGGGIEPTDHCGLVAAISDTPTGKKITIRHDSSGQHKLAENDWSTYFKGGGKFYRPGTAAVTSAASQASQFRASKGLPG